MKESIPWLTLVGIGEDGLAGLPHAAVAALKTAELVVGGARHLALVDSLALPRTLSWPRPMTAAYDEILARRGRPVCVLASGDPYFHGVGSSLSRLVPADEITCLPAPSSPSLAAARLGWPLDDTAVVSLCGRPLERLRPLLQPGRRILALSADAATPASLAAYLSGLGFGPSRLTVLGALGGPRESRVAGRARDFTGPADPLNIVAIEVEADPGAAVLPLSGGVPDGFFEHDGQITKREIRAVTLSSLAPRAGELLWDVGCGSGSVSIEWLLRHPDNRAVGIEAHGGRAARARRNARGLGVPGLEVREGTAPAALAGLPPADAVFIGGGAHAPGVIDAAWDGLGPGGRLVANGVTVETEAALIAARARLGGTLLRLGVERLDGIGSMHGFRPAMTVTQWLITKA